MNLFQSYDLDGEFNRLVDVDLVFVFLIDFFFNFILQYRFGWKLIFLIFLIYFLWGYLIS